MRGTTALFRKIPRTNYLEKIRNFPKPLKPLPSENVVLVSPGVPGKEPNLLKDRNGNPSKRVLAFNVEKKMTRLDIKNYLESIYGMKIDFVKTLNRLGRTKRTVKGFYKDKDIKRAYVHLAETEPEFEFPALFAEEDAENKKASDRDQLKKAESKKKASPKKGWRDYLPF
eukprot:Nk52_evm60s2309 gene=Nk52_evmTU60s2309